MGIYVLAIDLGTSSVRAMLTDERGSIACKEQSRYGVIHVGDYMQEQSAEEIFTHFARTARLCVERSGVNRDEIKAIAFSSQMYNIFPIDRAGTPLHNMILWSDSRSEEQAERLAAEWGKDYLYEATGCPLNSMYPLSKILWLRENRKDLTERTWKYISVKEYITAKMTGRYLADHSMASATGMLNIHTMCWERRALDVLGITEEALSEPVSGLRCFPFTESGLREELGLPEGVQVVLAGGDGPMAQVGSGASKEGSINVDLGTSGAMRAFTKRPVVDGGRRMWTYVVSEDSWVYGGILSNAGNGYQWLMRNIAEFSSAGSLEEVYDLVGRKFTGLPPVREGLLFIPYLLRCRSPYWDDKVKATIYGLTQEHTFVDIVKAYLESIGFDLYALLGIIGEQVDVHGRIILTGGLAKSAFICQLLADILGKEIVTLRSSEGSLMGAAIFALKAVGALDQLNFGREPDVQDAYVPRPELHGEYQKKYAKYEKLRNGLHELEA